MNIDLQYKTKITVLFLSKELVARLKKFVKYFKINKKHVFLQNCIHNKPKY